MMAQSLINTIASGGCLIENREDSPGHTVVIPHSTRFRIAVEGSQSHRYVFGLCESGYFRVEDGEKADRIFDSANAVVNEVREPSSNAFLYLYFYIGDNWVLADGYRRSYDSCLDPAEERALDIALVLVRKHAKWKDARIGPQRIIAAKAVQKYPTILKEARRQLASIDDLHIEIDFE